MSFEEAAVLSHESINKLNSKTRHGLGSWGGAGQREAGRSDAFTCGCQHNLAHLEAADPNESLRCL